MRISIGAAFFVLGCYLSQPGPARAAQTPDAEVRSWCGLKANSEPPKQVKTNLKEEAADLLWNNVTENLDKKNFTGAFKSNDRLLADPGLLKDFLVPDSTTKPGEPRPFPMFWVAKRIDVMKGFVQNHDKKYALRAACSLLTMIEKAERNREDKFDLNIELSKIGRLFADRQMYAEKEALFRYGLFLLTQDPATRCMAVFIGRTLCDGLVDGLLKQQKFAEAARYVDKWLGAIASDVGRDTPDYLSALSVAAEILSKSEDKERITQFGISLLEFSRQTIHRATEERWLDYAKDFSWAHFSIGSYWETIDASQASEQFAEGAAWGTRLAVGIGSLDVGDARRKLLPDTLDVARYLNEKAGPLVNKALINEWRSRKVFLDDVGKGSKEALVRTDPRARPAGVGWMRLMDGYVALDDVFARSKKDGDADDVTTRLFVAVAKDIDGFQGKYHEDAIESRTELARYFVWNGDRLAGLTEGDDIVSRIRSLTELDLAGWETWQEHLSRWAEFLTWYRNVAIQAVTSDAADLQSFRRALSASQLVQQSRASWTVTASLARQNGRNKDLAGLLRSHEHLYDSLVANEACLLSSAGCGRSPAGVYLGNEVIANRRAILLAMADSAAAIKKQFPEYAAIATPQIFDEVKIRSVLGKDELLVVIDANEGGGAVLLLSQEAARAKSLAAEQVSELARLVKILRCGVDKDFWFSEGSDCPALVNRRIKASLLRPFSNEAAYRIYQILFGDFGGLLQGKKLLVQPSGVLAGIPIQILLTEAPSKPFADELDDYRALPWLAKSNPVSLITSISNLLELRGVSVPSRDRQAQPTKSYVGFGNPLLDGVVADGSAQLAREGQSCADRQHLVVGEGTRNGPALPPTHKFFTNAGVNLEELRKLPPLPETADEICQTGAAFGAAADDIFLGSRATEANIRSLDATGQLERYKVIHFATHALVSTETQQYSATLVEPAIVLTPPSVVAPDDDGLLTSSEISNLRINADWVVLSACNTATGDRGQSEALSGLARSFFSAGARSVLVSHWPVDSFSGKILTTTAMERYVAEPGLGRASALQFAIVGMINAPDPAMAHPLAWAPFSVVTAD
jgi:hypothetical protein